jgi:hypothetical protein
MQPNMTQTARAIQSQGRGKDTMLVHMTPKEVGGLQALAMAHGGSLTINPNTGLPEAGFLDSLLPTILGVALTPFMGPLAAGLTVGGVETVRTGDIGKGFLAGLGAYGGANLAGSLSSAGAQQGVQAAGVAGQDLMNQAVTNPAMAITETGAGASMIPSATAAPTTVGDIYRTSGSARDALLARGAETLPASVQALPTPTGVAPSIGSQYAQMGQGFKNVLSSGSTGDAARTAFMEKAGGLSGLATDVGMASAPILLAPPKPYEPPKEKDEASNYEGPYTPSARRVSYPTNDELRRRTSEFTYFTPSNPVPFAEGGETSTSTSSGPDVAVSPAEARVYQDIISAQRLAGLPALDPRRFAVMPDRSYEQFVYNPIDTEFSGTGTGGEINYGFVPRSRSDANPAIRENMLFFRPKEGSGSGISRVVGGLARGLLGVGNSPDNYEVYMPSGRVDMANYYYDPALGGYVQKQGAGGKGGGYATGGRVSVPQLEDGGFVLTKKAVDGLGRGSNKKGQENARRGLGAIPIKGPGTGTSDSIKTNIDGKRPALVSNGEAYVPKRQVAKRGGAKAFYALMNKAEKAADRRKRA